GQVEEESRSSAARPRRPSGEPVRSCPARRASPGRRCTSPAGPMGRLCRRRTPRHRLLGARSRHQSPAERAHNQVALPALDLQVADGDGGHPGLQDLPVLTAIAAGEDAELGVDKEQVGRHVIAADVRPDLAAIVIPYAAMSETSSNCSKTITPARKQVRLSSLTYNTFLSCG